MNKLVFPLVVAFAATAAPTLADDVRVRVVAPDTPSAIAYVLPNAPSRTTAPNDEAPYGLRVIGKTTSVSSRDLGFFKLDFSHALSPMQLDAVYDREIQRVFVITHDP